MRFVYVMDEESMKLLKDRGYNLLKADSCRSIWVFENREETLFDLGFECPCVLSDVLTF